MVLQPVLFMLNLAGAWVPMIQGRFQRRVAREYGPEILTSDVGHKGV